MAKDWQQPPPEPVGLELDSGGAQVPPPPWKVTNGELTQADREWGCRAGGLWAAAGQVEVEGPGKVREKQARVSVLIQSALLFPLGFPGGKEPSGQCRRRQRRRFSPWGGKMPCRRKWQPTPVFLPGKPLGTEEPGGLQSTGSQRAGHD